jgi:hypothetical protein
LTVEDPRRLVLPPVDESQLHLLQVEMKFEGRVTPRVDLTFGGAYIDEVSTEMTALPLVATGKTGQGKAEGASGKGPSLAQAQDWFLKDGQPLRVITVERATAQVVVVMGRAFPLFVEPGERLKIPKTLHLEKGVRVRFLFPNPEESQGVNTTFNLFPVSPAYNREMVGDVYGMLSRIMLPPAKTPPRLASAVAVAGLSAYESRRRRAVVLIPPSRSEGGPEALNPAQVRRYLERLRVPLYVWDPEARPSPATAAWGEVQAAGTMKQLAAAFAEVAADLDQQWIVWLDGRHLPQEITLSPSAQGFALR